MLSVPYSRYIIEPIPWYSFLIVLGASFAVFFAERGARRTGLKQDTMIDLALILLPAGILGARLYYVIFSWKQFRGDLLSVFKIWEGGLAIYGGILAGILVLVVFARRRKLSLPLLLDLIAPGLAFAQGLGRWGNYFNMEAYGLPLANPVFCFFPLAVQIPGAEGMTWHMATFFYESVWDFFIFLVLLLLRRRRNLPKGSIISFYAVLYTAGRFIIESLRMDSLYAASSVRISQVLSAVVCVVVFLRTLLLCRRDGKVSRRIEILCGCALLAAGGFQILVALAPGILSSVSLRGRLICLAISSGILIAGFSFPSHSLSREVPYANNPT